MATVPDVQDWRNDYPTTDGKPMAETDWHRKLMTLLIQILEAYYAGQPLVYVSGNLLIFYVPGNKRRHISPDVFVVKGVLKHDRLNYLLWEEKPLDLVIELTSSSTRHEDTKKRFLLYQDTLKVKEYFLFDPEGDYLDPPSQGYRLVRGEYRPIRSIHGRLPSKVLGLHLEGFGKELRLYDPAAGRWLPTLQEQVAHERAERGREKAARERAELEVERLRRELESFRPGS